MTGRHTRHIVLAVLATVVLSAASCAPQDSPPQEVTREEIENLGIDDLSAQTTEAYDLVSAHIQGLRLAEDASLLLTRISEEMSGEVAADAMRGITATQSAILKIQQAERIFGRFSNSADENLRLSTGATVRGYNTLLDFLNMTLTYWERVVPYNNLGGLERLNDLWYEQSPPLGPSGWAKAEAWEILRLFTGASTLAIVDHDRRENGKTPLKITDAERRSLVALLEDQFGVGVSHLRAGMYTPEDAAATWWLFLATYYESTGLTGTAFIVHPNGLLLTAHHVIYGATSIAVSCNGQPAVPATVASSSPTVDLAVLKVSQGLGTRSFLTLSPDRVPSLGDTVFTMGYPTPGLLGPDVKYTEGTVSALSGPGGDSSFLQISVPIQPGNSGGPLVDEAGDVVGIVVATADAPTFIRAADAIPQNINWAVKSVFASALFTPPSVLARLGRGWSGVNERVTEATCLVRTTVTAQ